MGAFDWITRVRTRHRKFNRSCAYASRTVAARPTMYSTCERARMLSTVCASRPIRRLSCKKDESEQRVKTRILETQAFTVLAA